MTSQINLLIFVKKNTIINLTNSLKLKTLIHLISQNNLSYSNKILTLLINFLHPITNLSKKKKKSFCTKHIKTPTQILSPLCPNKFSYSHFFTDNLYYHTHTQKFYYGNPSLWFTCTLIQIIIQFLF